MKQNVYRQRKLRQVDGTAIKKALRNRARPEIPINTDKILEILATRYWINQDLAFLLKVSFRTLQRYRASGKLPYFMISHKTYYRAADIRVFIQENADCKTYERFKKENQLDKQTEANQGG